MRAHCILLARAAGALALGACAAAAAQPPGTPSAAAARAARITAAIARIDPMTASLKSISPVEAFDMKAAFGRDVHLFDLRVRDEAAAAGVAVGTDALVPYLELDPPLRWVEAGADLTLRRSAHFVDTVLAWVAARGGDHDSIVLLLCRDGEVAAQAARDLLLAGFVNVRPIRGGFEGSSGADGRRQDGWKHTLPWLAAADDLLLFGSRD